MNRRRAITAVMAGGLALATPMALSGSALAATGGGLAGTVTGAATGSCRGEPAYIINVNLWIGTNDRDVVVASAAVVDELWGEGGNDLICVYNPSDRTDGVVVHGGRGNDTIMTLNGHNEIYGDDGDDIVYLNGGGEYVQAGAGNDHVWALGVHNGMLADGGPGTDMLQGSPEEDVLYGGDGADLLIGAGGEDRLFGDAGDDVLQGGAGPDDLFGDAGNDTCTDSAGSGFDSCELTVHTPPFGATT